MDNALFLFHLYRYLSLSAKLQTISINIERQEIGRTYITDYVAMVCDSKIIPTANMKRQMQATEKPFHTSLKKHKEI